MQVIQLVDGPKAGKDFRAVMPQSTRYFHVMDVAFDRNTAIALQHTYELGDDGRYYFRETSTDVSPAALDPDVAD